MRTIRRRTSSSIRSNSCPMSSFVFGFRASQKLIRRNLNSVSCGQRETSLKNITRSPCAEERATSDFCFFGMADETALLPLGLAAIAKAALDFPCGFIVAEGVNIFLLVFWSLKPEELPLGSIGIAIWENFLDFNGNIIYENRSINRTMERKVKGIYWLSSIKGLRIKGETDLENSNEKGGSGKAREEEVTTLQRRRKRWGYASRQLLEADDLGLEFLEAHQIGQIVCPKMIKPYSANPIRQRRCWCGKIKL